MMRRKSNFPPMVKWMFLTAIAFLIFMTIMRFVFYFHFAPSGSSLSNYISPFFLGLNFDVRIICGFILFPFVIGNLHLYYNDKKSLTAGSIIQLILMIVIMVLLLLFMHKGHATPLTMIGTAILFVLIFVWLFAKKSCNPFENRLSKNIFKIYFFIISFAIVFLYAIDFENYDYLHERLNASVVNLLGNARISMRMVWETYPVFTLILLILIFTLLLFALINRWFKKNGRFQVPRHCSFQVFYWPYFHFDTCDRCFWKIESISAALERRLCF